LATVEKITCHATRPSLDLKAKAKTHQNALYLYMHCYKVVTYQCMYTILAKIHNLSKRYNCCCVSDVYMTLLSEIHHCSLLKPHRTLPLWNVVCMHRSAVESKTKQSVNCFYIIFTSSCRYHVCHQCNHQLLQWQELRDRVYTVCTYVLCIHMLWVHKKFETFIICPISKHSKGQITKSLTSLGLSACPPSYGCNAHTILAKLCTAVCKEPEK